MQDRTVLTIVAIVALAAVGVVISVVRQDAVVLAPVVSAILILMGYEGYQQANQGGGQG